jgi:flagellar hook-length control protein FliK
LTKAAAASSGSPKTNADSPVGPQLGVQVPAQTGRAPSQVAGEPQGHAEPANAGLPAGDQSAVHAAVSSARLTQQAGSAEMQVRLRTEALGSVDVHTILKGSDIGASIRVEAREAQVMMANEISRLEQALNDRNLRVQRLDVLQGSLFGNRSGGTGPGNDHGNPSQPRPGYASPSVIQAYPALLETEAAYEESALGPSTTRINLRV